MKKYEYTIATTQDGMSAPQTLMELNSFGEEGWRVIQKIAGVNAYLMEREKE